MCAVRQNSIYWKSRPFASVARHVRIDPGSEFDPQRGTLQLELLAKPSFQVTAVTVRHVAQGIAVNHDHGRIGPSLVRVTQYGALIAGARRNLPLDRGPQRTGQAGRGQ